MNKLLPILIISVVAVSSCNRKLGILFSRNEELNVVNPDFDYLSAKSKFRFKSEGKRISANANFRFKKDSIIWISLSGFGFEGARVLIDQTNVKLLDKLNNQYYEYTFEELSKEYDFDFSFEMMQSVLLGNLIEPYTRQKVNKDEKHFSYNASIGNYLFTNFVGINSMKLERVVVSTEDSKNTISVSYSDFILVRNQVFPSGIRATIEYDSKSKSDTEISIGYNKMEIESSQLKFPFSVPAKYERK